MTAMMGDDDDAGKTSLPIRLTNWELVLEDEVELHG